MSPILDSIGSVKVYGWGAFASVPNSFESIATLDASGAGQVAFTSIPQTYTHLQIRCHVRSTMNYADYNIATIVFRVNGASIRGPLYSFHSMGGSVFGTFAGASTGAQEAYAVAVPTANVDSNVFAGGVIDILDYSNTNKFKTFKVLTGANDNTSNKIRRAQMSSILFQSTSEAISSIYLSTDYNFAWATGTKFSLYGIKTEVA